MDWINFVGKAYYTIPGFKKEAHQLGVSRRVAVSMLSSISWGDRIWLVQGDMKKKTRVTPFRGSIVFGSFRVHQLGGLSPEGIELLAEKFSLKKLDSTERRINRNCGFYIVGGQYQVNSSLAEIGEYFRDSADGFGSLLLQGPYTELKPRALLPEVSFRWGYRRFHGKNFMAAYRRGLKAGESEPIVVPGDFKNVESLKSLASPKTKTLEVVKQYRQAELYSTLASQKQ